MAIRFEKKRGLSKSSAHKSLGKQLVAGIQPPRGPASNSKKQRHQARLGAYFISASAQAARHAATLTLLNSTLKSPVLFFIFAHSTFLALLVYLLGTLYIVWPIGPQPYFAILSTLIHKIFDALPERHRLILYMLILVALWTNCFPVTFWQQHCGKTARAQIKRSGKTGCCIRGAGA